MGPRTWHEFIYPQLKRMYAAVRAAGKFVMIHSCGDVDELFDDSGRRGLNCFNPFQPEVMDVYSLLPRLSRQAGLSRRAVHAAHSALRHGGGRAGGDPPASRPGRRGRIYSCPRPRCRGRRAAGEHAGRDRRRTTTTWVLQTKIILTEITKITKYTKYTQKHPLLPSPVLWSVSEPGGRSRSQCCGRSLTEPRRRPKVSRQMGRPSVGHFGGVGRPEPNPSFYPFPVFCGLIRCERLRT